MSELFDEESASAPPPQRSSRRSRALIITAVVLVLAVPGAARPSRRSTPTGSGTSPAATPRSSPRCSGPRPVLFLVFGALMALVVGRQHLPRLPVPAVLPAQLARAERPGPLPRRGHPDPHLAADRRLGRAGRLRRQLGDRGVAQLPRCGATACRSTRRTPGSTRTSASTSSTCPGCHYLVDFTMAALVIALIAAAVVHYLYGGIRLQTPRDRLSGAGPGAALGAARPVRAGQGRRLLARPLRPGAPSPGRCSPA